MGDHHHHHGHAHAHSTENISTAFWLNLTFTVIEIIGGVFTNSMAILSDALHDFGDSLSLGLAWYFQKKAAAPANKTYTYGYSRFSVMGALINAAVLIVGSIFILKETIPRLTNVEHSEPKGMFLLAIFGIGVNGLAVLKLKKGTSLNERAVMLHLLEDVLGWVAVIIGSGLIYFFKWYIVDPILSLGITAFVFYNAFINLRSVFRVILQATPEDLDPAKVESLVANIKNVMGVHDIKIWSLDGTKHVASMHIVINNESDKYQMKSDIRHELLHLDIAHVTIETEVQGEPCSESDSL